jgi:diguanylate cyclase (GGDEF)-like protein
MLSLGVFPDFTNASSAVLAFLHQRLGFDLWMVTRTEGSDWIILQIEDHGYGVKEGTVFSWADSFCSHMVLGNAPRIAPCSDLISAYAAAPIGQKVPIGAYVGVPLLYSDGSLFGTLCAIHPIPQSEAIAEELSLIELLAALLSSLLNAELNAIEQTRRAERAQVEALSDPLTELYNRRGWDRLLAAEEKRCQRYGHSACVLSIDLDDLKQVNDTQGHARGDELIRQTGNVLQITTREQDIVARVGGDEFAILAVECDRNNGEILMQRLQSALSSAQIKASLGLALRDPTNGLKQAWQAADLAMYTQKLQKGKTPR